MLVGKRAWNVTLDKAEARLYVVNGLSDDVTVVDVAGAKAIKTHPGRAACRTAWWWSNDGASGRRAWRCCWRR